MNRGDVWDARLPDGQHRPVVLLTRDEAIPVLVRVTVAPVTRTIRGIPSEVPVGLPEGLSDESVVSCDNILTIPRSMLERRRGELGAEAIRRLDSAIMTALGIETP